MECCPWIAESMALRSSRRRLRATAVEAPTIPILRRILNALSADSGPPGSNFQASAIDSIPVISTFATIQKV